MHIIRIFAFTIIIALLPRSFGQSDNRAVMPAISENSSPDEVRKILNVWSVVWSGLATKISSDHLKLIQHGQHRSAATFPIFREQTSELGALCRATMNLESLALYAASEKKNGARAIMQQGYEQLAKSALLLESTARELATSDDEMTAFISKEMLGVVSSFKRDFLLPQIARWKTVDTGSQQPKNQSDGAAATSVVKPSRPSGVLTPITSPLSVSKELVAFLGGQHLALAAFNNATGLDASSDWTKAKVFGGFLEIEEKTFSGLPSRQGEEANNLEIALVYLIGPRQPGSAVCSSIATRHGGRIGDFFDFGIRSAVAVQFYAKDSKNEMSREFVEKLEKDLQATKLSKSLTREFITALDEAKMPKSELQRLLKQTTQELVKELTIVQQ